MKKKLLNVKKLKFLVENCSDYLTFSSPLIKSLLKDNKTGFLDIIFEILNFFDNEFILQLLFHYKNQNTITTSNLKKQISKYKILNYQKSNSYIERHVKRNPPSYEKTYNKYETGYFSWFSPKGLPQKYSPFLNEYNQSPIEYSPFLNGYIQSPKRTLPFFDIHYPKYTYTDNSNNDYNYPKNSNVYLINPIINGNVQMVKYLVKNGLNINHVYNNNYTPLHIACKFKCKDLNILKYLIKHGVDVNKRDKFG